MLRESRQREVEGREWKEVFLGYINSLEYISFPVHSVGKHPWQTSSSH